MTFKRVLLVQIEKAKSHSAAGLSGTTQEAHRNHVKHSNKA